MNMWHRLALLLLPFLAACASTAPAPVEERGAAATQPAAAAVAPAAGYYVVKKGDTLYSIALDHGHDYKDLAAWNNLDNPNMIKVGQQLRVAPTEAAGAVAETKPVAIGGAVEGKSLEGAGAAKPAPAAVSSNTDTLKREPRGGTIAYSDQALAQAQAMAGGPAAPKPAAAAPADKSAPPVAAAAVGGEDAVDWAWPAKGQVIAPFVDAGPGQQSNKGIDLAGKAGDSVLAAGAGKVVYVGGGLRGYGNLVIVRHNASYLSAYAHNSRILVKEGQSVAKGQKIAEIGSSDADRPELHFEIRHQGKPVDPTKYLPPR
jgi:lipoprotein NlpD